MVTGAILHKQHLLREDGQKEFFMRILFEKTGTLNWQLEAWAVLYNHYHFIAQAPENSTTLAKLIRQVHSITAIQINRWDNISGRQSGRIIGTRVSRTRNPI
jgi:REP element-mobilizing transposase RayT